MKTKQMYTKGPWVVGNDAEESEGMYSIWYDNNGTGVEIAGRIGEKANAQLIVGVHDLLEAAKVAIKLLNSIQQKEEEGFMPIPWPEIDKLEQAILKVEGEK